MSQIRTISVRGNEVRFGLDAALGWWYDESVLEETENGKPEYRYLADESTTFTELSKSRLFEWLLDNLPQEEKERLRQEIMCVALDLDPGDTSWVA